MNEDTKAQMQKLEETAQKSKDGVFCVS